MDINEAEIVLRLPAEHSALEELLLDACCSPPCMHGLWLSQCAYLQAMTDTAQKFGNCVRWSRTCLALTGGQLDSQTA